MKKRLALGVIISFVFLYFAFKDVNWADFWNLILGINYLWLIPALLSVLVSFALRSYRWKMLLDPVKKVTMSQTFSSTMIGYMGNNVLPFRLGDLVRAYALSKETGLTKSSTIASLLLERILDLLTTLMALGFVLAYFPNFPIWATTVGWATLGIVLVLMLFTVSMQYKSSSVIKLMRKLLSPMPDKWIPTVEKKLLSFSDGLQIVSEYRKYFGLLMISILHWPIYMSTNYFTFQAFGYDFGIFESFVVVVFITFAVAIPAAPGFVGTFHGLVVASLALFGLKGDPARAYAVVVHAVNYIPVTIVGLAYFWSRQLSFKEIEGEVEELADEETLPESTD